MRKSAASIHVSPLSAPPGNVGEKVRTEDRGSGDQRADALFLDKATGAGRAYKKVGASTWVSSSNVLKVSNVQKFS